MCLNLMKIFQLYAIYVVLAFQRKPPILDRYVQGMRSKMLNFQANDDKNYTIREGVLG